MTPTPPVLTAPARTTVVVATVVVAHAVALWLLQLGWQGPTAEPVVPAEVLLEWVTPAHAAPSVPVPPTPSPPAAVRKPTHAAPPAAPARAAPVTAPTSPAQPDPKDTATADAVAATQAKAGPEPAATASPAPHTAPAAQPRIELPSTQADYLSNPRPPYPPLSRRLGEQGKVVLRVLIGTDGSATQAQIHSPSGYDRLDQAALQTVLRWRYVPGKRDGVPQAMWFNVPIQFVLE